MRRLGMLAVGLIALAIGLTACLGRYAPPGFQPQPDAESIEGTWTHHAEDASDGAWIDFSRDGTFEYSGVPEVLVTSVAMSMADLESADLVDGEGVWTIDPESSPPAVNLGLDRADPALHPLSANPFGFDTLYFTVGDPDLGDFYEFDRD